MKAQPTQLFSNIEIDGVLIHGQQDTGAEINAMPLNVYNQLNQKLNGNLELRPCGDIKVIGYSKQSVQIVGKISVTCTHANVIKKANFYITDIVDTKVILRLQFCRVFNLIQINCDEQCMCKQITADVRNSKFPRGLDPGNSHSTKAKLPPVDINLKLRPDCKAHIMELYPDLFEGVSTMDGIEVKLDVDPSVPPVVQPPRKMPQAIIKPLKKEIDQMLELKVIRKLEINEATDWCHNLVLVRKPNGKLRVDLDPCTINKALRFNVHNACTFQDIVSNLGTISKVSKIDANSGFWTLPMNEESQLWTTSNTPWGCYCFTKMPFGLSQAQYFFQYYMDLNFQGINSTTNIIADDVMIHGQDDSEYDRHLLQVLNKCREIGLKLNPDKGEFSQTSVTFYGNVVSNQGLRPDPRKVDVIMKMPPPQNKTELASFLGMCNYLSIYVPRLSDVTSTLQEVNRKKH